MPNIPPPDHHWSFERRWGPAAIIAALALFFTIVNVWNDRSAANDKRITVVETQNIFIMQSLARIEQKLDKNFP